MIRRVIIFIAISFLAIPGFLGAGENREPHLGLYAASPSENVTIFKIWVDSGARVAWQGVRWPDLIGEEGQLDFSECSPAGKDNLNLYKDIHLITSNGGVVVLHVHTAAGWSGVKHEEGDFAQGQSSPPKDLKKYHDFVYQLVTHFKDKVKYYEIESEPYWDGSWLGTNEEYFQLLETAYKAARSADKDVNISNGSIAYGSLVVYRLNELLKQGKAEEAIGLFKDAGLDFYISDKEELPAISNREELEKFLEGKRRIIDFIDYLFKKGHKYIDILQFHIYEDYNKLEDTIKYVKSKMQEFGFADKPVHMRIGWDSKVRVSEDKHRQDLVKNITIAFSEGVSQVIWFSLEDINKRPTGLIGMAPGRIPVGKPAYFTFQLAINKLEGFSSAEKLDLGKDIYGCKFLKDSEPIYVLWSEKDNKVKLSLNKKQVRIITLNTAERLVETQEGVATLDLSPFPIFVEAQE